MRDVVSNFSGAVEFLKPSHGSPPDHREDHVRLLSHQTIAIEPVHHQIPSALRVLKKQSLTGNGGIGFCRRQDFTPLMMPSPKPKLDKLSNSILWISAFRCRSHCVHRITLPTVEQQTTSEFYPQDILSAAPIQPLDKQIPPNGQGPVATSGVKRW